MGFGGKIDDRLDTLADQFLDPRGIHNVPSDEMVTRRTRETGKIFEISGVRQLIDVNQRIIRVGF
jgi:hypothetical protein